MSTTSLVTLILILIVFGVFCYAFWSPFFRGKRYDDAVVDGFAHPEKGDRDKKDITYVVKFMYREKSGKRRYCVSKREFGTQGQLIKEYPKGKKVSIRVYKETDGDINDVATILSDNGDLKTALFHTIIAFVCCSAMEVGLEMLYRMQ